MVHDCERIGPEPEQVFPAQIRESATTPPPTSSLIRLLTPYPAGALSDALLQIHEGAQGPRGEPSRPSSMDGDGRHCARRRDKHSHSLLLQGRTGLLQVHVLEPDLCRRHGILSQKAVDDGGEDVEGVHRDNDRRPGLGHPGRPRTHWQQPPLTPLRARWAKEKPPGWRF